MYAAVGKNTNNKILAYTQAPTYRSLIEAIAGRKPLNPELGAQHATMVAAHMWEFAKNIEIWDLNKPVPKEIMREFLRCSIPRGGEKSWQIRPDRNQQANLMWRTPDGSARLDMLIGTTTGACHPPRFKISQWWIMGDKGESQGASMYGLFRTLGWVQSSSNVKLGDIPEWVLKVEYRKLLKEDHLKDWLDAEGV